MQQWPLLNARNWIHLWFSSLVLISLYCPQWKRQERSLKQSTTLLKWKVVKLLIYAMNKGMFWTYTNIPANLHYLTKVFSIHRHILQKPIPQRLMTIWCYTFLSTLSVIWSWIPPPVGFDPGISWSEVRSANHSANRTLVPRRLVYAFAV